MSPRVSVIVPVYNSVDYIADCVQSVLDQTIDRDAVELIVVDDGSTDGSDRVLSELAAEHPRLTVVTQENSGTPGGARNPAIDRATGDYVFFLDSDDVLAPSALERMADTADREKSDVVLVKVAGLGGRRAPASMFKKTVLDADLLEDNVFNTLGPWKLIRRSVIDDLHLRFPIDQKVGEDQPFMAAAYLNARKISILADQDYYFLRRREDSSNMTLGRQDAESQLLKAVRLAAVIEEYTEPGALRDRLLRRPYKWSLPKALDGRWLDQSADEQRRLAQMATEGLAHLATDGVRKQLSRGLRTKLELLLAADLEGLALYIAHERSAAGSQIEPHDGAFRLQVPDELAAHLTDEQRIVSAPTMTARLEALSVHGDAVTIGASLHAEGIDTPPDEVRLRLNLRRSKLFENVPVRIVDTEHGVGTISVEGVAAGLGRGIWDVFLLVRYGDYEKLIRLGKNRENSLEPEGASNLDEHPLSGDTLIAYYTKGYGNLSIDRGMGLHRDADWAEVVGLTLDENSRGVALVQTNRPAVREDEYFGTLKGARHHGGRFLLPTTRVGDRLLSVRLPLSGEAIGGTLTLTSVLGGARSSLPFTGAAHWPARAAGYGLVPTPAGGVTVVPPDAQPAAPPEQAPDPEPEGPVRSPRVQRLRTAVADVPGVGPTLKRLTRALRGGRR